MGYILVSPPMMEAEHIPGVTFRPARAAEVQTIADMKQRKPLIRNKILKVLDVKQTDPTTDWARANHNSRYYKILRHWSEFSTKGTYCKPQMSANVWLHLGRYKHAKEVSLGC